MPFLFRFALVLTSVFLLAWSPSALAQSDRTGDWIGTLQTPAGGLRLLVTIEASPEGELSAVLESLDQAPGQKIPVSTILVDENRLSFEIAAIGARFAGSWNAETESYDGVFSQGLDLPLSLSRPAASLQPLIYGMDGVWETDLVRGETVLHLVLNIETAESGTTISLDSVDQGAYGIPVVDFVRDGEQVSFRIPAANVSYVGTLDVDATSMTGNWTRPGYPDAELRFDRTSEHVTPPHRPQEPVEPLPYPAEEVRFANAQTEDVILAGTFTRPATPGPHPAVVLISGSGPQDRDESVWEHRPFAVLADHLTRNGIAVLRYDDRGFGESTGNFANAVSADFATDTAAAVAWLQMRDDVDPDAIGLIGHSEGGLIAPMLGAGNDDIAFLVLLAAPGTTGRELILEQSIAMAEASGLDAEAIARIRETSEQVNDAAAADTSRRELVLALNEILTSERLAAMGVPEDQREMMISQLSRDWYRSLMRHDPLPWLEQLEQPVLAINGTLDLQVLHARNLAGIRRGLADNPDATVLALDGLNHLFQTAETGLIAEYATIEETFSPDALDLISDWINARFGTPPTPSE